MKHVHDEPGSLEKMMKGWRGPLPDLVLIHSGRITALDALIAANIQLQGGVVLDLDLLQRNEAGTNHDAGGHKDHPDNDSLSYRMESSVSRQSTANHKSIVSVSEEKDHEEDRMQDPGKNVVEEHEPDQEVMEQAEPVVFGLTAPFLCPSCHSVAPSATEYHRHMKKEHGAVKYICALHDKVYSYPTGLKRHIRVHHEGFQARFWCDTCDKGFYHKCELNTHMSLHVGGGKHECPVCAAKFLNYAAMLLHRSSIHMGVRHTCRDCNADFATKGNLDRHRTTKHQGKRHCCPSCDKSFTTKDILNAHRKAVHEQSQFDCGVCGFKASYLLHLKSHHFSVHVEKSINCNLCDKSFHTNFRLKEHINSVHLKTTRPCLAAGCGKILSGRQSLARHSRDIHHPAKIDCQLCPAVLGSKISHKKHLQTVHCITTA